MDWLLHFIQQGLSFLIPLIILLGLLIFVHEMGHFLVAKFYKVKVEVFSLGFGKKIFQFQRGETTYCVSLIPLGGYVKMFGDDPTLEVSDEQKEGAFLHKPVGQRIAIVLAGPLMNFFFAILLFFGIAIVGEEMIRPVVGDVALNSPAWEQGFRPGDLIHSVNGKAVVTWNEVKDHIQGAKNKRLSFTVTHKGSDELAVLEAKTSLIDNPDILSTEAQSRIGDIKGLDVLSKIPQIGVPSKDSLAGRAGLQTFDEIIAINQTPIDKWYEFEFFLKNYTQVEPLYIEYLRDSRDGKGERQALTAQIQIPDDMVGQLSAEKLGLELSELYISQLSENAPAKKSGLLPGDKILAIDGESISNWVGLMEKVQNYDLEQGNLQLDILRDGQTLTQNITPELMEQNDERGGKQSRYALGIYSNLLQTPTEFITVRTTNPLKALQKGVIDTLYWTQITCLSFLRLLQGSISHRSIGGPIMIGQVASRTFKMGLSYFLKVMAIISINLFIINMFPIPVLDGGHLVFFTLEALRGAPLSMRKMEIAQTIGLILLLSLMALAIFNDITRVFSP